MDDFRTHEEGNEEMSRIFTIDIGNTAAKGSVFDGHSVLAVSIVDSASPDSLIEFARSHGAEGAIYCNVRGDARDFAARLRAELDIPVEELTSSTPLPFGVDYSTPGTLGVDRVAAAAGAIERYGGDLLVVDAGTAVTADIVAAGRFLGGNISPGLRLRFRSLNEFTGKLPLVRPEGECGLFGHDTETAIRCGVFGGLIAEVAGEYHEAKKIYKDIKLILTGGDAQYLQPRLKEKGIECELDHDLVGLGLVSIYNYNRK